MCDMCDGKSHEQARREMLERIAQYDYTKIGVECEQQAGKLTPCWTYSVGLWSFHHVPEVVVVGAHNDGARAVDAYAELARAGETFKSGQLRTDLLADHTVLLQRVDRARYRKWFSWARYFYPAGKFPAYQLIWRRSDGCWPWEPDWHSCEPQPVLTASGHPDVDPRRLRQVA